jgi:indolepyruvate ferredoxin oxidoreductase, beta subunit
MHRTMSGWGNSSGGEKMSGSFDILIVGIGGQGTILASNVLGEACLSEGRPVKGAETHGMAQRGGSVESHIRIDGLFGPLIPPGHADLMISFDLLEALRYSHYLKKGGKMVVNRHLVLPTSVYTQKLVAPTEGEIIMVLKKNALCLIDADRMAEEAGSPLSQNVVMLGAASKSIPLKPESLLSAVRSLVPKKTIEINATAFENGREFGGKC